ncbi:MAG: DUF5679 domain-containing protein [Limisphaerales bacterium]|jgi:Zn finger protein HypA/HybF involved in hydrogenase expression
MVEGYCNKCKVKKEIVEAVEVVMKNGRKAIKGKCPTCGAVIFKIIGGKVTQVDGGSGNQPPQSSPPGIGGEN